MDKEMLNSLIESGLPEEYYMLEGVVYMYTFPNDKVYIGRTCRDPEVCHNEHLHPKPYLCNKEYLSALQECIFPFGAILPSSPKTLAIHVRAKNKKVKNV